MKQTRDIPISLELLVYLLRHKGKTIPASKIANDLGCSVRSIYRHIDILTIAGFYIEKIRGRGDCGGGYYLQAAA